MTRKLDQRALLNHIVETSERLGYPPSVREIADEFDVSRGTAQNALKLMLTAGLIARPAGVARAVAVTPAGMKLMNTEEMT